MSSPPKKSAPEPSTEFQSLTVSPDYDVQEAGRHEREVKRRKTDFQSLARELPRARRRYEGRSITDFLIDAVTPFLIFWMVFSVIFFLLDVRFIYTETEHIYLRIVAFSFVMGVVALNRLIAREGSAESILYIVGLGMAIGIYTMSVTGSTGSVAAGFLDSPGWATLLNVTIVNVLWWTTNRLMHETCIDENRTAGDIGILTGTLRNFRQSIGRESSSDAALRAKRKSKTYRPKDHLLEDNEIEAIDPLEWKEPAQSAFDEPKEAPTKRLATRHPGISIFFFSLPAMLIFALGLPVLMRGGPDFVLAGHVYVGLFTGCALMLLMLTSLSGIRHYFRSRQVRLPNGIGAFWMGLGTFMVAVVLLGALQAPMPAMPIPAYIEEHETDYWTRDSRFELTPVAATAAQRLQQSHVIQRISVVVLGVLILFGLFASIRTVSVVAGAVGRRRDLYPQWVVNLFNRLDRMLAQLVSLPPPKRSLRRGYVSAASAKSSTFRNPMSGQGDPESSADVRAYIEHAYDALCALAADVGKGRGRDQTPYEFLRRLPAELKPLRKEAAEVTALYVEAAYSELPPEPKVLDRLRRFWMEYEKVRRRYVR